MTEVQFLASQITTRFGTVKRARGPYLYTAKRVRLTDLFQEGGRSILGWGSEGSSAFTVFKNIISRGVTGSFDTDFSFNAFGGKTPLSRALSQLLAGDRIALLFDSKDAALKAGLQISSANTSVYRPWNPENIDWRMIDCVVIQPPLPWASTVYILAIKDELFNNTEGLKVSKVASPLEAAIVRGIYDLIKALQNRQEKDWFVWDKVLTEYFERKGPYLYPKIPQEKYQDFVLHCLDCNVVISPSYNQPSIVPFGADRSAFKNLEKNPFEYQ